MRERDLREALAEWFESHEGDFHVWRTPVGALIKARLLAKGNFKNAPRGRPTSSNLRAKAKEPGARRTTPLGGSRKIMPWEKDDEE